MPDARPSIVSRLARALGFGAVTAEIGVHGTDIEGAGTSWEEQNDALGTWADTMEAFDDILMDPIIRGADRMIVQTCLSGTPRFRAPGDDEQAQAVLDYCERAIGVGEHAGRGRMATSFETALRPMLTSYLFGVAVAEQVLYIDPDDGLAYLRKLAFRRQRSIEEFKHNAKTGAFEGIRQCSVAGLPEPKPIPARKLLMVVHDEHLRLSQGMGLLRSAYMMRRIKKHTWGQIAIGVERWANATPKVQVNRAVARQVGGYDEAKLKAEIATAVANAQRYYSGKGKYLVGSDVVDFDTFGQGQFDPSGPLSVINEADKQNLLLFLVQFLIMGVGDVGSRALGLVHQNILQRACQNLIQHVTDAFVDQVLEPLVIANFGPDVAKRCMPAMEWIGLDFEPLMEALGQLPSLVASGLIELDRPLLNQIRQGLKVQPRPQGEPVAPPPAGAGAYANPGEPGPGRPEGSYDDLAA